MRLALITLVAAALALSACSQQVNDPAICKHRPASNPLLKGAHVPKHRPRLF